MNSFLLYDYMTKLDARKKGNDYIEGFAEDIAIMAESLADYYGEDYKEVVYSSILNCRFVKAETRKNSIIRETVKDVLERENLFVGENTEDLNKKDCGFFCRPVIQFDGESFKLANDEKVIVLPANFDSNSFASLEILARCCIELVKSSINTYKIRGNVLTTKSGFMTIKETLECVDGNVVRSVSSVKGKGLSNGMNCYDQLCVIREMYEDSYDVHGQDYERLLAGYILETCDFKDELRLCELAHDDAQIKEAFKQKMGLSFDEFIKMTDSIAQLEQNRQTSLMNEEELKIALDNLDNRFGEIAALINSFQEVYEPSEKII